MTSEHAPPASLGDLIELDVQPRRVWRGSELGAILRHELSLPLSVALGDLKLSACELGTPDVGEGGGLRLVSLGTLLHHARPPLELLERVKQWAKSARHDPQGHLPEDVAAAVYALAIAAALLRHGRRITSMSDAAARNYLEWARGREWLDAASARLLGDAIEVLTTEPTQ